MNPEFGEMLDTPPESRARYYAMIARLSPAERARKAAGLSRAARDLARAGIRRNRPDATPLEVEIEVVSRLYGADVAALLAPHLAQYHGKP